MYRPALEQPEHYRQVWQTYSSACTIYTCTCNYSSAYHILLRLLARYCCWRVRSVWCAGSKQETRGEASLYAKMGMRTAAGGSAFGARDRFQGGNLLGSGNVCSPTLPGNSPMAAAAAVAQSMLFGSCVVACVCKCLRAAAGVGGSATSLDDGVLRLTYIRTLIFSCFFKLFVTVKYVARPRGVDAIWCVPSVLLAHSCYFCYSHQGICKAATTSDYWPPCFLSWTVHQADDLCINFSFMQKNTSCWCKPYRMSVLYVISHNQAA